jgi:hypothetical protein
VTPWGSFCPFWFSGYGIAVLDFSRFFMDFSVFSKYGRFLRRMGIAGTAIA